jgi:hypothetical protein
VLTGQPVTRLDSARRNAIFNADVAAVRARFAAEEAAALAEGPVLLPDAAPVRRRRSWVLPAAAAAVLAISATAALKLFSGQPQTPREVPVAVSEKPLPPEEKVNIAIAPPAAPGVKPHQAPPQVIVKSTAPALPPLSPPPAVAQAPVVPPALVQQPVVPAEPKPEAASVPPALKEPVPDFATPEKRRDRSRNR